MNPTPKPQRGRIDPDPVRCLVGVGGNIDPLEHIPRAVRRMEEIFDRVLVSTFYWTRPLLGLEQDPYVNGVLCVRTSLSPRGLKRALRDLEDEAGRIRSAERYAPRRLDLDLLTYGDGSLPELGLPDDDLLERDFVLIPAAELCPDWVHPAAHRSLSRLAAEHVADPPNILKPVNLPANILHGGTGPRPTDTAFTAQ